MPPLQEFLAYKLSQILRTGIFLCEGRNFVQVDVIQGLNNGTQCLLERHKVCDIFYLVLKPFSLYHDLHPVIMAVQRLRFSVVVAKGMRAGKPVLHDHLIAAHGH